MLHPCFQPFPELKTERLVLRQITTDDKPEIFFLRSNPDVLRYIDKEPAVSMEEAAEFIRQSKRNITANELIIWGIVLQENQSVIIGTICFWQLQPEHHRAEIGYVLHPGQWGKGLMSETMIAVIQYGFSRLNLHSIEARVNPVNQASISLLEKSGFSREAYYRENYLFRGQFLDTAVYSLLKNIN